MRVARGSTQAYGTALAACVALGLAVQSCGVMSSSDCAERATCFDAAGGDSGGSGGGSGSGGDDEGPEGAAGEAGDDGNDQTEIATDDVRFDTTLVDEVNSDVGSIDVVTGESAMRDVASDNVAIRDVVTDEAARSDVCIATEDCTDGFDNNCNGLVDCADPLCKNAGYVCTATVPSTWNGPALLWTGAFGAVAPSCPVGYVAALDAHAGLSGSADSCSCVCAASGQTCSTTATFHPDQMCTVALCGASAVTVAVSSSDGCVPVPTNTCGSGGSFNVAGGVPAPSGGSCTPTVTKTPGSAAGWTTSARVCSWTGVPDTPSGCSTSGEQCVLGPPGSFGTKFCVYQSGITSCPVGYPNRNVFSVTEDDSRDCGSCSCSSAPSGGSCAGSISMWGDQNGGCGGSAGATYTLGSACRGYTGVNFQPGFVQAAYTVTPGTCSVASPPLPTGAVTASGSTTVCCK